MKARELPDDELEAIAGGIEPTPIDPHCEWYCNFMELRREAKGKEEPDIEPTE